MTTFSKLLTRFITEKGITIYSLAKNTGIERSYLQKIKAGSRLPQERGYIDALAEALSLTPAEAAQFEEAYFRAQMGEEKYRARCLVRDILSNFYTQEENDTFMEGSAEIAIHLDGDTAILRGQPQVNRMLKAVLQLEANQKDGCIRLLAQPSYQYLYDTIATMNLARNHTRVENILCFDKEKRDGPFYNLETFRRLVPILYVQEHFIPYYMYEYVSSLFNDTAIFPYVILTSRFVMHVSYDTKQAVLYNRPDLIRVMNEIFGKKLSRSSRLFQSIKAGPEEYFYSIAPLMDWDADNLNIMYQPCLIPFCPVEVVKKAVNTSITSPDGRNIFDEIISYFTAMNEYASRLVQNFTMEGLVRFMEEGYVIEIPRFMMNGPLPPAARLALLRNFIHGIRDRHVPAHLIRTDRIHIPPQMMLTSYAPNNVVMHYYRKDGHIFLLQPKELSLASAFQDFLEWFPESHLVYSAEDTLAQLEACYKEYTEKFRLPVPLE